MRESGDRESRKLGEKTPLLAVQLSRISRAFFKHFQELKMALCRIKCYSGGAVIENFSSISQALIKHY
jgi:hypothetical protein